MQWSVGMTHPHEPSPSSLLPLSPLDITLWMGALTLPVGRAATIDAELAMLLDEALLLWPPTAKA